MRAVEGRGGPLERVLGTCHQRAISRLRYGDVVSRIFVASAGLLSEFSADDGCLA